MLLHTADWHLGKVLDGVPLLEEQRDWFMRFCDMAASLKPELILICGDLFDYSGQTDEARHLFDTVMERLFGECACPIVATTGNHDEQKWLETCCKQYESRGFHLVTKLPAEPLYFVIDSFAVAVHPIPFLTAETIRSLGADSIQQAMETVIGSLKEEISPEIFQVVMAHGLILPQGNEAVTRLLDANHDSGATLVDSALFEPFDYTALGHIHANLSAQYRCYYAGSPLVYDKKEIGQPKGFNTVTFMPNNAQVKHYSLVQKHPVRCLEGSFDEIESAPPENAKDAYLYLSLTDTVPKKNGFSRMKALFPRLINMRYALLDSGLSYMENSGLAEQFAAFLFHCGETVTDRELEILKQLENHLPERFEHL